MRLFRYLSLVLLAGFLASTLPAGARQARPTPPSARRTAEPGPPPAAPDAQTPDADPDMDADMVANEATTGRDVVVTGSDVRIREGEVAHDILVNGGDVLIEGEVTGDIIVFLGKATILGKVNGDIVNLGRGVSIENGGFVGGQVLAVGYGVSREPDGIVQGQVVNLGLMALPASVRQQAQLFFDECIMMARPLSVRVGFVWIFWGVMLLFQGFLALLFPSATQATLRAMRERPGGTTVLGIFGLPLVILTSSILTVTFVGIIAVPFLFAALFIGLLIGRIAILRLLGGRMLRLFGTEEPPPAAEFAVGAVIATLLFLIPVIGVFAWMVFVLWALGGILMALFRRDSMPAAIEPAAGSVRTDFQGGHSGRSQAQPGTIAPIPSETFSATSGNAVEAATPTFSHSQQQPSSGPSFAPGSEPASNPSGATALGWQDARQGPGLTPDEIAQAPRPPFSRRIGALLIDWIPLFVLIGLMPNRFLMVRLDEFPGMLRVVLGVAYFTLMLAWRGTTLGGLLMGLRVVRLDGRPIDRTVALVRALTAILSTLCLGIGWFWASWDPKRQSWHDRLAGTVVIRDDQVQPLI